jgi:WD40 repeat protein
MIDAIPQGNPYVGPRTFKTTEKEYFFGRDREAQDLLSLVISQRLVLFYAQSGAGKSSLVNTKLIPGLIEEKEYKILPVGRILSETKKEDQVANIYILNLISSLVQHKLNRETLSHLSLSQFFGGLDYEEGQGYYFNEDLPQVTAEVPEDAYWNYVLIIDQFEELFTSFPEEWKKREDFFQQLTQALDDFHNLSIVLVMREDYVALLDPYAHLVPGSFRGRYYMQRLGHQAAMAAVDGPAARQNRPFEAGVAEKLVNDLSSIKVRRPDDTLETQFGQYVEPVQLQVVCSSLWEKLPADFISITQEHLDRYVGDVNNALGNYYEERVRAVAQGHVAQDQHVTEHEIRDWFGTKLITPDGIRNMIAREPGRKSGGLEDAVIQEFLRQGDLVRAEKRGGATFYELTHDRLVEPILANNKKWEEATASPLERQAKLWQDQNKNENLLLQDKALEEMEAGAKHESSLTELEEEYLQASRARQQQLDMRRQRERERRQRAFMTLVILGSALSIGLGILAYISRAQAVKASVSALENAHAALTAQAIAEQNVSIASTARAKAEQNSLVAQAQSLLAGQRAEEISTIAQAGQLASQSDYLRDRIPALSALLSVEAFRRVDNLQTRSALLGSIPSEALSTVLTQNPGPVYSLDFSPDGHLLATGTRGRAIVWDVATLQPLFQTNFGVQQEEIIATSVSFSSDSALLAVGSQDGTISLWAVPEQHINFTLIGGRGVIYSLAFSPDGKRLVSVSDRLIVWDLTSGVRSGSSILGQSVITAAFSPDGKTLAYGGFSQDGKAEIKLIDAASAQELASFPASGNKQFTIAFGPDGQTLVSAGDNGTIILWDLKTKEILQQLDPGGSDLVLATALDPEAKHIATSTEQNEIVLWDVAGGVPLGRPLQGHTSYISSIAFSPDGKILVSASDVEIILWDLDPEHWIEKACQAAGRNFTRLEWKLYLPDEPYLATCPHWPASSD